MTQIVQVAVTQTIAPAPSTLQRTGAIPSQGATTTAEGTLSLLTQMADLTAILTGALAITTLSWASSVVTVTTTAPHGFPNGDTIELVIASALPAGYNGTFACTITGASTFTYPLTVNPGTMTAAGVYTPEDVGELVEQVTTFFGNGSSVSVYVLELGAGTPAEGVTALGAFITANPLTIYSYLVQRSWAAEPTFVSFVTDFNTTTSLTYFFITALLGNYASFTVLDKCCFVSLEAPGVVTPEFSAAADFWVWLSNNPSSTNPVAPMAFRFLTGVTPYPTKGNAALLATLKTAFVNIVGTGAEGGISNTILLYGKTKDGRPLNYWYSVDWMQINVNLNLSNEIINGSNDQLAPLYYNQQGINRLQARVGSTAKSGVAYGLALGQVVLTKLPQDQFVAALEAGTYDGQIVINAIPFASYNATNPDDYALGVYNGLSMQYTPATGFESILFNINVTDFVAA